MVDMTVILNCMTVNHLPWVGLGVQRMGCFVLSHLLAPELLEKSRVCNQNASVVSMALEKHHGNMNVVAEVRAAILVLKYVNSCSHLLYGLKACCAVLKLAHAADNIARTFIKHRVHMQLFKILEKGPDGRRLLN